jgi:HlyD family secretion protein
LSALLIACNDDRSSASAAEPPRIEVKAAVAPFDSVNVVTPIDGRVASVNVAEGATVHLGDVVIQLTNPSVDRDIAYARAQLVIARAKLRPHRADTSLLHAKQEKLARYRALLKTGDVSKQDVQDAEAEVIAATPHDPEIDRDVVQAEIERAQADEALAQHRQAMLTISAPASGTIAKMRVRVGDDVFPRDTIAEIVDASTARVQAQVAPELLRFIHTGSSVDVKLLTVPPRTFREPVARVDAAESTITVNVPNPDRLLRPGTPAVLVVQ